MIKTANFGSTFLIGKKRRFEELSTSERLLAFKGVFKNKKRDSKIINNQSTLKSSGICELILCENNDQIRQFLEEKYHNYVSGL